MADSQSGKSREGFGDGQGTRVGKPDAGRSDEGGRMGAAGTDGNAGDRGVSRGADAVSADKSTGAGAEAAEGVHGLEEQGSGKKPGDHRGKANAGSNDQGSEPLEGRNREHRSGYGGSGGEPVASSDQREPQEPSGNTTSSSGSKAVDGPLQTTAGKKDPRTGQSDAK